MTRIRQRVYGCCLLAGVLASSITSAAEPARSTKARQREAVEALLAKPVEWNPADSQPITIEAFIAHVREKHGLAIRWDAASIEALSGGGVDLIAGLPRTAGNRVTAWSPAAGSPAVQTYSPVVPDRLQKHVTNFTYALVDPTTGEERPLPIPENEKPAPLPEDATRTSEATAGESFEEDEDLPHRALSLKPISRSAIALTGATVGEALEQLLAAAAPPIVDSGETLGVPLSIRALTLDSVIDGRTVVITTRLRANALKETRVYRLANVKGMPAEQVARTICHSIRPWSWRSQASEIADRMASRFPKGSLKLPQVSIASQYIPNPIQMAGGEVPEVPPQTPSPLPQQQSAEISAEELANFGQLLTGGAIAAVESIVNAVEIVHYGDPPTGVMEVLPGVLVITQSQGAHREIAELLDELAAAGGP